MRLSHHGRSELPREGLDLRFVKRVCTAAEALADTQILEVARWRYETGIDTDLAVVQAERVAPRRMPVDRPDLRVQPVGRPRRIRFRLPFH